MSTEVDMEKYAEQLYDDVKKHFNCDTLTAANTFELMRIAMELVDTYKGLEGKQKKELVIRVLHNAFDDYVVDEIENEAVRILIDNLADIVIDNFVDIDLGHLSINHPDCQARLKKFLPCCFKDQSN